MKEEWKDIPGYKGMYQISNLGNVRSLDRYYPHNKGTGKRLQPGKVMKVDITHRGYATVILQKNRKRERREIHTLVAAAFLGKRPAKHHTHHRNHNKLDNRASNLIYISSTEHISRHNRGVLAHKAKLSDNDIKQIRRRIESGEIQKDIAADYGVSRSLIGQIKQGRIWTHVQ